MENSSKGLSEETIYTQNLDSAKIYFQERVAELSHIDRESLYKKITQKLLFNIFTIAKEVDVCVAFETMNNRGKRLSYLELLKNRMIYLSIKLNEDDYEKRKLRQSINDCWKAIYHNLGRNENNPLDDDLFLRNHFILYNYEEEIDRPARIVRGRYVIYEGSYHLQEVSYTSLLRDIFVTKRVASASGESPEIVLHDIYQYVSSLQAAVECWYHIFNPFDSHYDAETKIWLDKLNRMDVESTHHLILAILLKVKRKDIRVKFLKELERYTFLLGLKVGFSFIRAPQLFDMGIELFRGKTPVGRLIKELENRCNSLVNDKRIVNELKLSFRSEGFYKWSYLRYFLYEYNLYLQEQSKTDRPKIFWAEFSENRKDYLTVEHIYPQKALSSYWKHRFPGLTPRQRDILRNSLGNLLPLSKPKNSSLSNKPFPEKVDGAKSSMVGFRFGSYAENEVSKQEEWTPDHILHRGIKLLEFMEKRWKIELGPEASKVEMLGLDFVGK